MATYYADSVLGNDANDGTSWESAKATIQAALSLETTGRHNLWLRNTHTIASNVTIDSAQWCIVGESPESAGIILTTNWQATGTITARHGFKNLTITPQVDLAFPQSPAEFSGCVIEGTTFNWMVNYRQLRLYDCVVTGSSNSYGILNSFIEAEGTLFKQCKVTTANTAWFGQFKRCLFSDAYLDIQVVSSFNQCSFWNSSMFVRANYCSFINNVFAHESGPSIIPQLQFSTLLSTASFAGNVQYNTYTNIIGPILIGDLSVTVLDSNPFTDPDNDDFTPSEDLAAIVGTNGFTPGAIQATPSDPTLHPLYATGRK